MKYLTLAVSLLALSACVTTEELVSDMIYFQDPRTGLCFASWFLGQQTGVMTNVPSK